MAPSTARVLVTQPIASSAVERLRRIAALEMGEDSSRIMPKRELIERIARADVLFHVMHDVVDAEVLAAATRLRLIACMAAAPATLDFATATARKILVSGGPSFVAEATADMTWALLLATARRVVEADAALRAGVFPGSQSNHFNGAAVHGKTLGIVGMGKIGTMVARRAGGFAMKVLYYRRHRLPEAEERELGVTYVPLEELLRRSDFVSVHVWLTPETRHLIGARELSLMKSTAILVNTARGPVVDESALVEVLTSRRIAGAGLDVYEQEPRVHPGLIPLANAVLTPHLGSAVAELREKMAHRVVDNIEAFLQGRRPPDLKNPEVLA